MQAFWGGIWKTYTYGINTLIVEKIYPLVINERGTKFTIIIITYIYCRNCLFTMKTERPIFLARTLLHIFWIVRAEFLFMRTGAALVAGDRLTMSADTICVSWFPAIPAETIFCLQGFHFGFGSVILGWGGCLDLLWVDVQLWLVWFLAFSLGFLRPFSKEFVLRYSRLDGVLCDFRFYGLGVRLGLWIICRFLCCLLFGSFILMLRHSTSLLDPRRFKCTISLSR